MVVALLAITGATYATAGHIVAGGFASLEQDEARQNLGRTEQALGVEMNRLDSTAADWSTWDDSYQFVRDGKTDFIEANLYDATLVNLRVDMMVFVDNNGDIVHSQAIDADGNGVELDEATTEALTGSVPLFDFTGTQDSQEGIVTTASGPLIVASRPIVTSDGEGPIAGALVMARWVDERLVSELRGVTKLDIILTPASSGTAEDPGPQRTAHREHRLRDTIGNDHHSRRLRCACPDSAGDDAQDYLRRRPWDLELPARGSARDRHLVYGTPDRRSGADCSPARRPVVPVRGLGWHAAQLARARDGER